MTFGVTRAAQKVERSIPEKVECFILAQPQTRVIKIHLNQFPTMVVTLNESICSDMTVIALVNAQVRGDKFSGFYRISKSNRIFWPDA